MIQNLNVNLIHGQLEIKMSIVELRKSNQEIIRYVSVSFSEVLIESTFNYIVIVSIRFFSSFGHDLHFFVHIFSYWYMPSIVHQIKSLTKVQPTQIWWDTLFPHLIFSHN